MDFKNLLPDIIAQQHGLHVKEELFIKGWIYPFI